MTGTLSVEDLRKELAFHEEMVGILTKTITDTEQAQQKYKSNGAEPSKSKSTDKPSIPASSRPTGSRRGKRRKGVNMSEEIRKVYTDHPKFTNKEVIAELESRGIKGVSDALVSGVKKRFFKKGSPKKAASESKQPAKATNQAKPKKKAEKKAEKKAQNPKAKKPKDLKPLIKRILGRKKNLPDGLKLADLTAEIIKAGYVTKAKKGNKALPQIVYQTLRSMVTQEKIVVHDKSTHLYRLNEAA